jgi:uncharacterized membrane protein YphA (DoxX/SURF4 family)
MQRLFFAFPGGWPGAGLLLMRTVVGLAILVQGAYFVREPDPSLAAWAVGSAAIFAACLLLIGFLTPLAGGFVALGALGIWLSLIPPCTPTLFDSGTAAVFALTILWAIVTLGPGAFSVDARVFGRREIIFPPHVPRSSQGFQLQIPKPR